MRYLLLTHIPASATADPRVIRWPAEWVTHLSSQVAALRDVGFDVTVATPMLPDDPRRGYVDLRLDDQPFTYAPGPGFRTMTQFVTRRPAVRRWIDTLARDADLVQLGPGGHPVALGQIAWPIVSETRARRLLVFASDPIPARTRYAASGRNPAKRLAKGVSVQQLARFCAQAIAEADLVFTHDPRVAFRFQHEWSERCHGFFSNGMRDADLRVSEAQHTGPLRIACVASTKATRGVDHLFRAAGKALRLGARIEIDLAGAVIESSELMNVARDEKLEPVLRLHGKLSDAQQRDLLDSAGVYLSASLVPAADPIIFLACGRGLPIVAYDSDPDRDRRLRESGAGLIIPRGEINHLAQALLELAGNADRRADMARRALEWARANTIDAVHRARARLALACVNDTKVTG